MSGHQGSNETRWLRNKHTRLALILVASHLGVGLIGGMLVLTLCRLAIEEIGRETIYGVAIHESWEANRYDCADEYELAIPHRRNAAFLYDPASVERVQLLTPEQLDLELLWAFWRADREHADYAKYTSRARRNFGHASNIAKGLLAMTLEKAGRQETANRIWMGLEHAVEDKRERLRTYYGRVLTGSCKAKRGQGRPPLDLDQAFRSTTHSEPATGTQR